ncbi:MAG: hypothetical protein HKO10_09170, partial [Acidimicrobiia bacterium]|nr:hypothetical protein [Acidimicrobiia bacterium]
MRRRSMTLVFMAATSVLMAMALPALATTGSNLSYRTVDIDSNGDCEVEGLLGGEPDEFEDAVVRVTLNSKWIIATCNVQLDQLSLASLDGPFGKAQLYRDFHCQIGNDFDVEDVEAEVSRAVITPSGRLNVTCIAPNPGPDGIEEPD